MGNRLVRWLSLWASPIALLAWSEAQAVDFVMAHIECPSTVPSDAGFPGEMTSDGRTWQLTSGRDHRPYHATRIGRSDQLISCHYERQAMDGRYSFTVPGTALSCKAPARQPGPSLDCLADSVPVHIECPYAYGYRILAYVPKKIGGDPPFYPYQRDIPYTTFPQTIAQQGQVLQCTYRTFAGVDPKGSSMQSPRPWTVTFTYKVERKIVSCEEKSPVALDCRVVK